MPRSVTGASEAWPRLPCQYQCGRYSRYVLPPSARYWVTKSTTSEICGAEPVVSSQSIISGTSLPTTP